MTESSPARYEQIADHLREQVSDGSPGDRLPSDAELCQMFEVSRMTARQAVQLLVAEGLVVRRRGSGTFVATRRVPRLLGSPLSFTESMRSRGMRASSRLLAREAIEPSVDERKALELAPTELAYMLMRLRLADGTPMAIERAVMPMGLAGLLPDDLEKGSLHLSFEQGGRVPSKALAEVSARSATKEERELLELGGGGGVLLCEYRTIWDQEGRPLERTETRYAADRYTFEALLYRGEEGEPG